MDNAAEIERDQIIDYMKEHGSIDDTRAIYDLGIRNVRSRISEIRRLHPHNVVTERSKERTKKKRSYAIYRWVA